MKRSTWRRGRKLCKACNERWARFRYRGHVRWDDRHALCFRCYRDLMNRQRAGSLWTAVVADAA